MEEEKDTDVSEEQHSENEQEILEEATEGEETAQEVIDSENDEQDQDIAAIKEENEDLRNQLLRLQAEYDNFKKRTAKEKSAANKYKAEELATELLDIIDNFERALETDITDENKVFYDGVKMVYQQLLDVFESQGIKPIETVNQEFDPNVHHAVMQTEEADMPSNTVVEELQKGYMLKDKVIRPAMVKVNK